MGKITLICFLFSFIAGITQFTPGNAASSCNGPCRTLDDCSGQLICIKGKCGDDPTVGGHACKGGGGGGGGNGGGGGGGGGKCLPSGTLRCNGKSFPRFSCSPPVTSSTAAKLTLNNFSEGGDPSECDGRFHGKGESVVALSTGWYAGGTRCGRRIRIVAKNGRSTTARVVDECDSINGCDRAHAGLPPCDNNIVDGSAAVWKALGLNEDIGVVPVTWSLI